VKLLNHPRAPTALVLMPALCALLCSCATNPNSKTYTRMLTGSANPVGVQTGRLIVVAYDVSDGGPLINATVEVVAADQSVTEPRYYRQVNKSDWRGSVTFTDVPRLVNVSVTHARGSYARDNYVVAGTMGHERRPPTCRTDQPLRPHRGHSR
jgi:hypothetical protein